MNKKPTISRQNSDIYQMLPGQPDFSAIEKAAGIIKAGGLIVFPTRTLYGLGADAFNPAAVNRIFRAKQRPADKPVSVLVKSFEAVPSLAAKIPGVAVRFMEAFWPGRLTIVFQARPEVLSVLTANTRKIGIRVPEHPVAVRLVEALDGPLTGTSANLSGFPGADNIGHLPTQLIKNVDLIIDSGKLKGGVGSTVVDVTTDPPTVLREGEVSEQSLLRMC